MNIWRTATLQALVASLLIGGALMETRGAETSQASDASIDEVKVLAIGNSFTGNATAYLQKLAEGGGKKMTLFVAAIGGFTLGEHVERLKAHEANPNDPRGRPYGGRRFSLREALQKEDWNVVTIQQSSVSALRPETFQPSVDILISYIRKHAPTARIHLFETWAYPEDYYDQVDKLKLNRSLMREILKTTHQKVADEAGLIILPVGDAFERVAQLDHPITLTIPNDKHCNTHGEYLAGAVFYETIYRENVEGNTFRPRQISPRDARTLLRVVHESIVSPQTGTIIPQEAKQ